MLLKEKAEQALRNAYGKDTALIESSDLLPNDVLSLDFVINLGDQKCLLAARKAQSQPLVMKGTGPLANVQGFQLYITFGKKNACQLILVLTDNASHNLLENTGNGLYGFIFCPKQINDDALDAKVQLVANVRNRYICVLGNSKAGNKPDSLLTLKFADLNNLSDAYNMLLLAADIGLRDIFSPDADLLPDYPVAKQLMQG